jgi:hypothetical protein
MQAGTFTTPAPHVMRCGQPSVPRQLLIDLQLAARDSQPSPDRFHHKGRTHAGELPPM